MRSDRLERLWGDAPRTRYIDGEVVGSQTEDHDRQSSDSENADAFEAALEAAERLIVD